MQLAVVLHHVGVVRPVHMHAIAALVLGGVARDVRRAHQRAELQRVLLHVGDLDNVHLAIPVGRF